MNYLVCKHYTDPSQIKEIVIYIYIFFFFLSCFIMVIGKRPPSFSIMWFLLQWRREGIVKSLFLKARWLLMVKFAKRLRLAFCFNVYHYDSLLRFGSWFFNLLRTLLFGLVKSRLVLTLQGIIYMWTEIDFRRDCLQRFILPLISQKGPSLVTLANFAAEILSILGLPRESWFFKSWYFFLQLHLRRWGEEVGACFIWWLFKDLGMWSLLFPLQLFEFRLFPAWVLYAFSGIQLLNIDIFIYRIKDI